MVKTRSDGEPEEETSLEILRLKLELEKAGIERLNREEEIQRNNFVRREREAILEKEKAERDTILEKEKAERDTILEKEKAERDARYRREEREHELAMAHCRIPGHQTGETGGSRKEPINIPRIDDRCDPEAILDSFERMCRLYDVRKAEWVPKILPNLHGKALRAYSKMSDEEAHDYEKVKKEILKVFLLTPEEHRRNFRNVTKRSDESYSQMLNRMKDHMESWIKGEGVEDDFEKLKSLIIKEQFIEVIPREIKNWLLDRM